jgi:Glyoxalase-like domain
LVRLRQAVLVVSDLEPAAALLREGLGLGEPFRDPGVAMFGLQNVVFAIGDCFIEIVCPMQEGTAAGRQIERLGDDGGYMVLFDIEDLDGARERAEALGVRTVWSIDLPDISGTHMHPADLRGAIVSLDSSRPFGSWRWGGPDWTERIGTGPPGALRGITVAVSDPAGVAARWAEVLGVEVADGARLELDGAEVRFVESEGDGAEAIVEIAVEVPEQVRDGRERIDFGAARIALG